MAVRVLLQIRFQFITSSETVLATRRVAVLAANLATAEITDNAERTALLNTVAAVISTTAETVVAIFQAAVIRRAKSSDRVTRLQVLLSTVESSLEAVRLVGQPDRTYLVLAVQ